MKATRDSNASRRTRSNISRTFWFAGEAFESFAHNKAIVSVGHIVLFFESRSMNNKYDLAVTGAK